MTVALPTSADTARTIREEAPWARAWRRLRRRKGALVGLAVVLLFIALALLAPWIAPYDPIATSWGLVRKPPSWAHWFGTDEVGRDVLSRVIFGARASLSAGLVSVSIAVGAGVPLGLLAGLAPRSLFSRTVMVGSIFGFSLPNFWLGLMLILAFAVNLHVLPAGGRGETRDIFGIAWSLGTLDGLRHLILPALTLAIYKGSLVIRLAYAGTREAMLQDFVRFARAKGLRPARIVGVHVLKTVLIPVVTVLGLELGSMIAFAVVTETVFAWPGMGKLIIDSINHLDRPVIVAYLLITVTMFIFINLAVDILYSVLDPRVRLADVKG